jgi:hypothetical protein
MQLAHYLGLLHRSQCELAGAFHEIAEAHEAEPDVHRLALLLADECDEHAERLHPHVERYGEEEPDEPERLHSEIFKGPREGGLALLRDLHDAYLMAAECDVAWTLVGQAAQGLRDEELQAVVETCEGETTRQMKWLEGRLKEAAVQALVVA